MRVRVGRLVLVAAFLRQPELEAVRPAGQDSSESSVSSTLHEAFRTAAICNTSAPLFDDEACFLYAVRRTRAELHAELSVKPPASLQEESSKTGDSASSCSKRFYAWSFESFEKMFPSLTDCMLTTYSALAQTAALKHPCRAGTVDEADILMLPPYLAQECNWPAYGGGDCYRPANSFRGGRELARGPIREEVPDQCGKDVMTSVTALQQKHIGKKVFLLDSNKYFKPYVFPKEEYSQEGRIWAKVDSLKSYYRPGVDMSMPPPAFPRCLDTPNEAYEEPVSAKKYFVSFQGQMHTALRQRVRDVVNNNEDQLILDKEASTHDMDELLHNSRFNLILGGDVPFSYRFNEAVCGGGVPVMVTNEWVPPFNEFLDFDWYGVLVSEDEVEGLVPKLRAMTDDEVELRRKRARSVCKNAFGSTEASITTALNLLCK